MKQMESTKVITLLVLASVVQQCNSQVHGIESLFTRENKAVGTAKSADTSFSDIAFDLPDLAVNVEILEGQFLLEAFKSIDNDAILKEAGVPRASQLIWVSVGQPALALMQNETNLFHRARYGYYAYFEMLTDAHRRILAETASKKYNVKVQDSQIISLTLSKFECSFPVYDAAYSKYLVKGVIYDFRTFPLQMDFLVLPGSTEQKLLESLFNKNHEKLGIRMVCSMASRGKKLITNTLSISSAQSEQIGLSEKLFGSGSKTTDTVYVSREQTAELSMEMYSTLNIVEDYEIPEATFSEAFISEFISQTASSLFTFVPANQALESLSKYTSDYSGDIKPDVTKRQLSSVLKTESLGNKSRIIADEERLKKLANSNKNSGGFSVGGFGVTASVNFARENSRNSESKNRSLDDQLRELNVASKSDIKWEFEGEKIVPKSLNVAKLLRGNFDKTLKFRRVRIEKLDAPFNLKFAVYTTRSKASTPKLDRLNALVTSLSTKTHNISTASSTMLKKIGRLSEEFDRLSKGHAADLKADQAEKKQLRVSINNIQKAFKRKTDGNSRTLKKVQADVRSLSSRTLKRCRLCFKEIEGSSQCQRTRNSCTAWVGSSVQYSWTKPFRDDTDRRGGGCTYQWMLHCITS